MQECLTKAGLFCSWTGFGIQLELGHNVHPNSGISGAGEQQRRLLLLAWQEVAQQNTVGNEPKALTFPLLDSHPTCLSTTLECAKCACFALCKHFRRATFSLSERGLAGSVCTVSVVIYGGTKKKNSL